MNIIELSGLNWYLDGFSWLKWLWQTWKMVKNWDWIFLISRYFPFLWQFSEWTFLARVLLLTKLLWPTRLSFKLVVRFGRFIGSFQLTNKDHCQRITGWVCHKLDLLLKDPTRPPCQKRIKYFPIGGPFWKIRRAGFYIFYWKEDKTAIVALYMQHKD